MFYLRVAYLLCLTFLAINPSSSVLTKALLIRKSIRSAIAGATVASLLLSAHKFKAKSFVPIPIPIPIPLIWPKLRKDKGHSSSFVVDCGKHACHIPHSSPVATDHPIPMSPSLEIHPHSSSKDIVYQHGYLMTPVARVGCVNTDGLSCDHYRREFYQNPMEVLVSRHARTAGFAPVTTLEANSYHVEQDVGERYSNYPVHGGKILLREVLPSIWSSASPTIKSAY